MDLPMGEFMRFPLLNEKAHLDWEDAVFTDTLVDALDDGRASKIEGFFEEYIRNRAGERWGVKSPFLLPHVELFKAAAVEAGEEFKLIVTSRPVRDTIDSLQAQCNHFDGDEAFNRAKELQLKLVPHWTNAVQRADLVVNIEDTWSDSEFVRNELASLIRRHEWA
jgi:hypothetical protein